MKEITVVDWIEYEEGEDKETSIGGMGGFFKNGMRGENDYFKTVKKVGEPYLNALRKIILEEELKITGQEHQDGMTPLFSDGTVGSFTWRAWGDLMAATWSEHENKDYSYMDFYC